MKLASLDRGCTKGSDLADGKKVKDRITALLCANTCRTEKHPLFAIGKSKQLSQGFDPFACCSRQQQKCMDAFSQRGYSSGTKVSEASWYVKIIYQGGS